MDGPAIGSMASSGGESLGGVFVTIGADHGQLKAGLDDARTLCQQWEASHGRLNVRLAVDLKGASEQLSQFAAAVEKAPAFQLKFATGELQSEFSRVARQFGEDLRLAVAEAVRGVGLPGGTAGAFPGEAGERGAGGGHLGHHGAHGIGNAFNLHRLFHAIGVPLLALAGAEGAAGMYEQINELKWISSHPSIQLAEITNPGSGLGLASDPAMVRLVAQNKEIDEYLQKQKIVQAAPLAGELLYRLGPHRELEHQRELNVQQAESLSTGKEGAETARIGFAEASGRHDTALKMQGEKSLAGIREQMQISEKRYLESQGMVGMGLEGLGFADQDPAYRAQREQLASTEKVVALNVAQAQQVRIREVQTRYESAEASGILAGAIPGRFETGGEVANLKATQGSARIKFLSAQQNALASAAPADKESLAYQQKADLNAFDAQQADETERAAMKRDDIKLAAQEAGQVSLLQSQQKFHEARLAQINDEYEREKKTTAGATAAEKAAFEQKHKDLITAENTSFAEQQRVAGVHMEVMQDQQQASLAQMSGNTLDAIKLQGAGRLADLRSSLSIQVRQGVITQAQMDSQLAMQGQVNDMQVAQAGAQMQAQTTANLLVASGQSRMAAFAPLAMQLKSGGGTIDDNSDQGRFIRSQMAATQFGFATRDQMTNMHLDASIKSSQFAQHDELMSAHVAQEVEASKERIAQARASREPPEIINKTIRAEQERLRALRHGMFAGRSGALAGADEHGVAGLFGGLAEGRLQAPDLRDALGQLSNKNIADIARGTAPAQASAPNIAEIVEKMNQILVALGAAPKQN